jgi:hypothetical protein
VNARLRIGACLSLSGRFARFGRQAAAGLDTWRQLTGDVADLIVEDDGSDRHQLAAILPGVVARCDLLLGPYSTVLMRTAGRLAAEHGWLAWNHGGSGDDVEGAHPGHVVSVLTPTSRYAEPFVRGLAAEQDQRELAGVAGTGSFGRQVADGAVALAQQLGIPAARETAEDALVRDGEWDLLSAGVFEDDVELVAKARGLARPPQRVCTIAAGVRDFADVSGDPDGVYGIAQWFPGSGQDAATGPDEATFLVAYRQATGSRPDYPATQAAAGAAIAMRCAQLAGSTKRGELWAAAGSLVTSTLFGGFGIDPATGIQLVHSTALVRWERGELELIG